MRKIHQNKSRSFTERVYAVVRKIPRGSTLTYKEVAKLAGKPRAARAVAQILSKNYDRGIPCHRVIRSDGTIGGYNRGGETAKRAVLCREGYLPCCDS